MAKIQFENGKTVEFDGNPTPEDVEHVASQLGIGSAPTPTSQQSQLPPVKPGLIDMRKFGFGDQPDELNKLATQSVLKSVTGQGFEDRMTQGFPTDTSKMSIPQMLANNAGKAAMGTAGQVLDMATNPVSLVSMGLPPVAKAAGDAAGRIDNWLVKLPVKAFRYGKDPLNVMKDEAVTGNTIDQLANNYEIRLNQRVGELKDAVKNSNVTLNLTDPVNKAIQSVTNKANTSLMDSSDLKKNIEILKNNLATQYPDLNNVSLSRAVDLKKQLADEFPFSPTGTPSQNVLAKAAHQLHHQINDAIDTAAPEVGQLNDKVSSLIDISKAAQNRMSVESRNNPWGFAASVLGGGEGFRIGGVEGAITGFAIPTITKAAASPAVLSRVAWTLSKLSTADKINLFKNAPWFRPIAAKAVMAESQPLTGEYIPPRVKLPSPPRKQLPGVK